GARGEAALPDAVAPAAPGDGVERAGPQPGGRGGPDRGPEVEGRGGRSRSRELKYAIVVDHRELKRRREGRQNGDDGRNVREGNRGHDRPRAQQPRQGARGEVRRLGGGDGHAGGGGRRRSGRDGGSGRGREDRVHRSPGGGRRQDQDDQGRPRGHEPR